MTSNTYARPFFEFLNNHDLSLYKVAKNAGISEGTLRSFRDVPERQLTPQTKVSVANALCYLTRETINTSTIFPNTDGDTKRRGAYIVEPYKNTKFMDILWSRGTPIAQLASDAGVEEGLVRALLNNDEIPKQSLKQIADVLSVSVSEIIFMDNDQSHTSTGSRNDDSGVRPPELPRDLPIYGMRKSNGLFVMSDCHVGFTARPPSLFGNKDAYAIYMPDNSMSPRMRPGELIYLDPNWPPQTLCDVIVHIKRGEDAGHCVVVNFTALGPGGYGFTFYNVNNMLTFNDNDMSMHRVLTAQELIIR